MGKFSDRCISFLLNFTVIVGSFFYAIFVFPANYAYDFFFMFYPDLFRRNSPAIHAEKVKKVQEEAS